jgi:fructose 1,6-bisphosphatase
MRYLWLLITLAACAAPTWEKAGATPPEMEADLKQCDAAAPLAPQKRAAPGPRTKPGSNTIDFDSASERAFDRARKDDEAIAACMRAKGYVR